MSDEFRPSRRIVFHGLAALGVAAVLAGCGGGDDGNDGDDGDTASNGTDTSSKPTTGGDGAAQQEVLAKTSEVPVGGGIVLTGAKVVITQPSEGDFEAFSAICKHQGFTVTSVEDDQIICDHHGSVYDFATGDNIGGPAPAPLDPVEITVKGGNILRV